MSIFYLSHTPHLKIEDSLLLVPLWYKHQQWSIRNE